MGDRIGVMSGGELQQIGTPDEIYNSPATLFVAGFLGSPPMNLIEGEVSAGRFHSGQLSVPLAAAAGPATLGVRPQDMHVVPPGTAGALPVEVFALEHLGRESIIIADAHAGLKVRVIVAAGFAARVGERMALAPDPGRCLLFAPGGARMELRPAVAA